MHLFDETYETRGFLLAFSSLLTKGLLNDNISFCSTEFVFLSTQCNMVEIFRVPVYQFQPTTNKSTLK